MIKFYKTKDTFWRLLTAREKKVIDNYLDAVNHEIEFELGFNLNNDYVTLSGEPGNLNGLMSQEAYEEKGGSQRTPYSLKVSMYVPHNARKLLYVDDEP
ncbi:MAG: hypothetical protein F6K54_06590 [Okeania sp. SIO3B5]|uniref:hypothetical protein n=1 Tax=Okeania sp. SIO3B5 TaxID=2607811 RepID=UPI0013FF766C|nr:hypothetical protein [Okeania sp. SIO3B5]NEO52771.1 hypothetical protein [Okeania sp. SIO3B5]